MGSEARVDQPVRRIDFFGALSLATDFALGQPQQFAMKACVLAVRIADATGAGDDEIRQVLYQALLRYVGCNADTYLMSALLGDEYVMRRDFAKIDSGHPNEVIGVVLRALRRRTVGQSAVTMMVTIAQGLARAPAESRALLTGHCEVAERIAARLGLGAKMQENLGQLYERWDGRGVPGGLKGEAVAFAVRVVTLAQDAIVLTEAFGRDEAKSLIARRSGGAYDPDLAALALQRFDSLMADLDQPVDAATVRALDPANDAVLTEGEIDAGCLVIADMADMRMPHTIGHSRAVAELAQAAARRMRLPENDVRLAYQAGLVHDIGEVSVPVSIWQRSGSFSDVERDAVHLHPYHSERIVGRAGGSLEAVAAVASRHHERLDGSGYYRGCRAADLSAACRILAAAELWRDAIEPRPHRAALPPEAAAARLKAAIRLGVIGSDAGVAVLEAAGQRPSNLPRGSLAGLTPREVEVLRLLAQGLSAKEVARSLAIAPKTAGNHVQNLYSKLGVTTRAAAVLFAVENGIHADP
jgi:HD-GYP domain-containing protein (c-di-GMP phosphodiesterase class II)/DNA-binding CsgD family transcriptional regulator